MKPKIVSKKLRLSKKTIANIGKEGMGTLKGGADTDYCTGWCSDEHSNCVGPSFCGSVPPCY